MRFTIRQPAPENSLFAAGAFDRCIGREYEAGILVAVQVAEDGQSVAMTFDSEIGIIRFNEPIEL